MAKSRKRSARRELDQKLGAIPPRQFEVPRVGWVRAVRQALGMSAADLAQRMGVTSGAVLDLERAEVVGGVTLDRLGRAAEAMDCELVYALVPRTSLSDAVERQARSRIAAEIAATGRAMELEDQRTEFEPETIREALDALIDTRQLWKQEAG
jgi:predicted DNA-binding mobile mystery protein A